MRIRSVKPEFFKHAELFDAEKEFKLPLRLAFEGLWGASDREGRFKWRPRQLKTDILPYDDLDFGDVLNALEKTNFIVRYEADGKTLGYIPSFSEHQCINVREAKSILPEPPQRSHSNARALHKQEPNTHGHDSDNTVSARESSGLAQPTETQVVSAETEKCTCDNDECTCITVHAPGEGKGREVSMEGKGRERESPKKIPEILKPARKRALPPASDDVREVLAHLQALRGSKRAYIDGGEIPGAIKRGASVADCKLVLDWMKAKGESDEFWASYLTHTTPFRKSTFSGYLVEASDWAEAGRGPIKSGRSVYGKGQRDRSLDHVPSSKADFDAKGF